MLKESLYSFKEKEPFYNGALSQIYRLPDGRLLKVLSNAALNEFKATGISLEKKITTSLAESIEEINKALSVVFDNNSCCGYTMDEIPGDTVKQWDDNLSLEESLAIETYFKIYAKMERGSKERDKKKMVLLDMATATNTIIMPDGQIRFIDRESIQFGKADLSFMLSSVLGDPNKYINSSKFCNRIYGSFTPELNKTSLNILLFLLLFHVDLSKVGQVNPQTGKIITLADIFEMIGMQDRHIMNKVACNLSDTKKGAYLGNDLYRLMQDYSLEKYDLSEDAYIKRLTPKRAK